MTKLLDCLYAAMKSIGMVFLAAFCIIVMISIIFRYVLNDPLVWSEQVCRYLFIWMLMLAMPGMYRTRADICFDMIVNKFPDNVQRMIKTIIDTIVAIFGAFLGWQGIQYIISHGANILPGINIPQWIIYISQCVGGFILAAAAVEHIVHHIGYFSSKGLSLEQRRDEQ